MNSRFGVQLEGDEFDLIRIKKKVNGGITSAESRFVESFNTVTVLRCRGWDQLTLGPDLQEIAQGHLDVIIASLQLLEGCGPVTIGTLYELDQGTILNLSRSTPVEIRAGWTEAPAETFNAIMVAAEKNIHIRNALSALGAGNTWFDIYSCLESLIRFYGGEAHLLRKFANLKTDISKMKRTANSYRHTQGAFEAITSPMQIHEAIALLRQIVIGISDGLTVSSNLKPSSDLAPIDRTFAEGVVVSLNRLVLNPDKTNVERFLGDNI